MQISYDLNKIPLMYYLLCVIAIMFIRHQGGNSIQIQESKELKKLSLKR